MSLLIRINARYQKLLKNKIIHDIFITKYFHYKYIKKKKKN